MLAAKISLAPPLGRPTLSTPARRKTGPQGFACETLVRTVFGLRPVARLMAGDLLLDATGQVVELRSLRQREVRAQDSVVVNPSAFGLGLAPGRLDRVLIVGAGQKLGLRDWRTDLVFGKPVLTTAAALIDGVHVQRSDKAVTLYQLALDRDCVIEADGLKTLLRASDA